jgi:hypothetical protein
VRRRRILQPSIFGSHRRRATAFPAAARVPACARSRVLLVAALSGRARVDVVLVAPAVSGPRRVAPGAGFHGRRRRGRWRLGRWRRWRRGRRRWRRRRRARRRRRGGRVGARASRRSLRGECGANGCDPRRVDVHEGGRAVLSPGTGRDVPVGSIGNDEHLHGAALEGPKRALRQRDAGVAADRPQPEVEREDRRHRCERELERQPRAHRLHRPLSTPHAHR